MIRDKGNFVSAACLAAFGIYVISVAAKLAYVSEVGSGTGFFPLWLGIGLVLSPLVIVARILVDLLRIKAKGESKSPGKLPVAP